MYPLPTNPTVVVLVNKNGSVAKVASNIAPLPEFQVVVTNDPKTFAEESLGKTFNQAAIQRGTEVRPWGYDEL